MGDMKDFFRALLYPDAILLITDANLLCTDAKPIPVIKVPAKPIPHVIYDIYSSVLGVLIYSNVCIDLILHL
jgi:hypothetical protein